MICTLCKGEKYSHCELRGRRACRKCAGFGTLTKCRNEECTDGVTRYINRLYCTDACRKSAAWARRKANAKPTVTLEF